ncbi:head-tail connector protein [Mesorhizobium sp. CAU 1741]|uniref:head-tail connector protein n=1 Tax=Mesorhizobium sp. CAU 1741 TaxID=3140366 RepID=UPI00325A6B4D
MTLFRTVDPESEPVSLSEAKQNLRIDHDSEDDLLSALIVAAREEVEVSCGLALLSQHWRVTLDALPASGRVLLRRYPVREVTAVTLYGSNGEASIVDDAAYRLDVHGRPARLHFRNAIEPGADINGIEIDFEAGYGETAAAVPELLKRAVLVLVAHWYEFRATYSAQQQPVSYPPVYDRLIAPWRTRRL